MADSAASPKKKVTKPKAASTHPPVAEMVEAALKSLKDRKGTSLQMIKKYIAANYTVDMVRVSPFIKRFLKSAVAAGKLVQTKGVGASGSFKLAKVEPKKKPAAKKPKSPAKAEKPTVKKVAKKPAAKKSPAKAKKPAAKKVAKKPAAKKSPAKAKKPAAKKPATKKVAKKPAKKSPAKKPAKKPKA